MEVSFLRKSGPEYITGALRATTGKDMTVVKLPSVETWAKLLRTAGGVPHSPMRAVEYRFYLKDIPSWCTVHFIRHHIGFQPYVKSQRDDRNNDSISREDKPQGEIISMMFDANVNALINIAKARLCNQASKKTKYIMQQIKSALDSGDKYDQMLAAYMKPPCEWYSECFEITPCYEKK